MTAVVVLGAGMVGSVVAADLAADGDFRVTVADRDAAALDAARRRGGDRLATMHADLADGGTLAKIARDFDLVVGALPGALGYRALQAAVEAGRDACDISFMPENAARLDRAARDRGVTAVVDCGVAPGLSHMLAGAAAARLPACERIMIYVGGIPAEPVPPFLYKAAFSPVDVIEEYTRPARVVEGGRVVTREALGDAEIIEFPGVGALEAFATDGLRSLLETLRVPAMAEKTLRWPGHAALMRALRAAGLFDLEPVDVGGAAVRPRDLAEALLFPRWRYEAGEEDLTVMRVIGEDASGARLAWELLDRYDHRTATTSMARTTAYPCAAVTRLLARGRIPGPGIVPPERLGEDAGLLEAVLSELRARGINVDAA